MDKEILERIKEAKSPEDVLAIAKRLGRGDLTSEQAKELFDFVNKADGELPDEAVEAAAGGINIFDRVSDFINGCLAEQK